MNTNTAIAAHLQQLRQDLGYFLGMTQQEWFSLDFAEIEDLQFQCVRRRFRELRPKVRILDKLAGQVGIDDIASWDDLAPLALPHTMYKSYLAGDVEKGRYQNLTKWLATLTAHDLSGVDTEGCASLDDWMRRLEAATPLRPMTSSGTSGKISIHPRTVDEDAPWLTSLINFIAPYGDEGGADFRAGNMPILCPWPFDKGRQQVPTLFRIMRERHFGGREEMVRTQRADTILVEEQWLTGKLRRAEIEGKQMELTDHERDVLRVLAERRQAASGLMAKFAEGVVRDFRGVGVVFITGWPQLTEFSANCLKLGIKPEWAQGSVFFIGGGNKGMALPDGWRETIEQVLPAERYVFKETYGMTEMTALAPQCSARHFHPFPWGVFQVVDPDTSKPLPRRGAQTGRIMVFDLMPSSYWSCMLTGDEATVHWEGGCACGRKGPYFDTNIHRYSEARGGDDKITCAKSPDAFEKLEEFALSGMY